MFCRYSVSELCSEFIRSIKLSIPLGLMEMVYGISFFLSAAMVAHLGKDAMATNVLVWGVFICLMLFSFGTLGGISVMASQSCGAGELVVVGKIFRQGLLLSIIYSFPLMSLMWVIPETLIFLGQDTEIINMARPYFHAFTVTIIPFNICVMIEQFLIGIGASRLALLTSILCIPMEIFFLYALIFGAFGFPQCGLQGVSYALAISMVITSMSLLIYLYFSAEQKKHVLFCQRFFQFDAKYLYELIRIGTPLGCAFCIEVALLAGITMMMETLGRDVVAGHQIAMQCFTFAMSFVWGASQAATVRVGYEVGKGDRHKIKLAAYVNIIAGITIMTLISILYTSIPEFLIGIDINLNDPNFQVVADNAKAFIRIVAILLIVDCMRTISFAILRGLKDSKFAMYSSIATFCGLVFPLAYFFGIKMRLEGAGIWYGILSGVAIGGVLILWRVITVLDTIDIDKIVTKK